MKLKVRKGKGLTVLGVSFVGNDPLRNTIPLKFFGQGPKAEEALRSHEGEYCEVIEDEKTEKVDKKKKRKDK